MVKLGLTNSAEVEGKGMSLTWTTNIYSSLPLSEYTRGLRVKA